MNQKSKVANLKKESKTATKELLKEYQNEISESKKVLSDNEILKAKLSKLNVQNLVEKTAKSSAIWKPAFLKSLSDNDKSARRKARNNFQVPLCESIIKKSKGTYNRTASLKELCTALRDFYLLALVDINNYSNVSESSKNYHTIHDSYKIMKKELNF